MFRYPTTLKLRDTDAAGVAFFATYFAIAHDAYEAFLVSRGFCLRDWLEEIHLPIVHSEADYTSPIKLGDHFDIELTCGRIGQTSFTLNYHFLGCESGVTLARLKTVHVAVKLNDEGHESVSLPDQVRSIIGSIVPNVDEVPSGQGSPS